jgi:PDZ domain-containing secreted protein
MAQFATVSFVPSKVKEGTGTVSPTVDRDGRVGHLYIVGIITITSSAMTLTGAENFIVPANTALSFSNPIKVEAFASSAANSAIIYYEG